jgi:hypothetical protein
MTRHYQKIEGPDSRWEMPGKRPGIRFDTVNAKKNDFLGPDRLDNDALRRLQFLALNRR